MFNNDFNYLPSGAQQRHWTFLHSNKCQNPDIGRDTGAEYTLLLPAAGSLTHQTYFSSYFSTSPHIFISTYPLNSHRNVNEMDDLVFAAELNAKKFQCYLNYYDLNLVWLQIKPCCWLPGRRNANKYLTVYCLVASSGRTAVKWRCKCVMEAAVAILLQLLTTSVRLNIVLFIFCPHSQFLSGFSCLVCAQIVSL